MQKILKFFSKNKKILIGIGIGLFSVLFFFQSAKAAEEGNKDIWEWCGVIPGDIFGVLWCILLTLFSIPIRIAAFIPALIGVLLAFLGAILLLVVQPIAAWMIQTSITQSVNVPDQIYEIHGMVRNFANSLFFLFLAIIGLATILRIAEYERKKALVPLIIIALLINFSPAIVTTVAGIGNSLSNYFLGWAGGANAIGNFITVDTILEKFGALLKNSFDVFTVNGYFVPAFLEEKTTATGEPRGPFVVVLAALTLSGFIVALFFILAALVIGLFGLIYFIRIIFIWLLMIIAPIAFVTAVFRTKETKAIFPGPLNWNTWWTWLLEWSFMGIGLAIWFFLAIKLLNVGTLTYTATAANSTTPANSTTQILGSIAPVLEPMFPYLAALIALWIGATTAPGMMGQMAGKAFGMVSGFVTGIATAGAIAAGAGTIAGAKKFGESLAKREPGVTGALKAGVKGMGSGLATATRYAFGKALPEMVKPIPAEIREEVTPLWAKRAFVAKKEEAEQYTEEVFKKTGPKGLESIVKSGVASDVLKTAAIDKLIQERALRKEIVELPETKSLTLLEYGKAAKRGDKRRMGALERCFVKTLGEEFGGIAEKTGMYTATDRAKNQAKGIDTYTKKIIAEAKSADDIKELQRGWWEEKELRETTEKFWTGNQWGAAAREFGRDLMDSLEPLITQLKSIQTVNAYKKFVWERPGLARYSATTGAQELGFSSWYELAPATLDKKKYPNIRTILAEKP